MADSTMKINRNNITTFANSTANNATDLNNTITEIIDKFDAMLETSTGHDHDGVDSPLVFGGVTNMNAEEFAVACIMGGVR